MVRPKSLLPVAYLAAVADPPRGYMKPGQLDAFDGRGE